VKISKPSLASETSTSIALEIPITFHNQTFLQAGHTIIDIQYSGIQETFVLWQHVICGVGLVHTNEAFLVSQHCSFWKDTIIKSFITVCDSLMIIYERILYLAWTFVFITHLT
jgi:hypothetical protein